MLKLSKKEIAYLLFLCCISLTINLYSISYTGKYPLQGDQIGYEKSGAEIALGINSGSSYQAPLYQYFIAAIYAIGGRNSYNIRFIQSILSAFSILLVYVLAKRLFNTRTAVISGLLAASAIDLIFYCGLVLSETLFIFLMLIGLLCYERIEAANFSERSKMKTLTGILFGLASLVKTQFI
jgi:4-amino-4-deoxy-L-arabinose transferase-like glycosyltransferase